MQKEGEGFGQGKEISKDHRANPERIRPPCGGEGALCSLYRDKNKLGCLPLCSFNGGDSGKSYNWDIDSLSGV